MIRDMIKTKTQKVLPKILSGSAHQQFKKCGKQNCKCIRGQLHGPYYYRFARIDGKLRKRYLKADEVEAVQSACQLRQTEQKAQRRKSQTAWNQLRELRDSLREYQKHLPDNY